MSHWAACGATLLRSVILVALAVPVCYSLCAFLRRCRGWPRHLGWALLITPIVAPRLVTGYGYANFSLSLVQYPLWNEVLYDLLLLIGIVPIGATMLYFAPPPPVSAAALHCQRLSGRTTARLGFWIRGPVRQIVPACCLMFLVAFQEFELASLLGITSWTVWLFDAQAGGLVLSQSLRFAVVPLLCELAALLTVCVLAWKSFNLSARRSDAQDLLPSVKGQGGWLYLVLSVFVFCIVPWTLVLPSAFQGLGSMMANFTLAGDIAVGCGFALIAGLLAYVLAAYLLPRSSSHFPAYRKLASLCISVPGLLGSLVLGLTLVFVFQLPALHVMYDTSLPWLVGLVLFLIPRAVVLLLLWGAARSRDSQHVATLLLDSPRIRQQHQARELMWRNGLAAHFWALVLLCYWAYADLTTATILAPTGIVSAPVRLYNLMHYGQSAVLSAMVLAAFGIPALLLSSMTLLRRPLLRLLV